MNPLAWVDYEILGNSVLTWVHGTLLFLGAWGLLFLVHRGIRSRLRALAKRKGFAPLRVAEHISDSTRGWFLMLVALFVGSQLWSMSERAETFVGYAIVSAALLQAGFWLSAALVRFLEIRRAEELEDNPDAVAVMDILSFVGRVAIWSLVVLLVLDNLGITVTTLVAGLGVGGIAVALAAQNVLGDLFASLSIVLDKPFVVGDFLIIGESLGTVEKVGIKTTRIRSLSGEQLILSNNDLLHSRIRNYGRMYERRVLFSVGVTYQTPAEKLKRIPTIIRESIEAQSNVRFDRAHFQKYGDFALIFEVVYFVLTPSYNEYMDIQQAINLAIYERFESEGIEFAYPTQTLYMSPLGPANPAVDISSRNPASRENAGRTS
jgi:small-conductance mechanosensitive channel